ncbi:hypothetical protein H1C71_009176 [Ictidomys tridecemlineatus]|nr:hypothetical protein H1C71_009176 [Ictidomys tridecemlineatus]
MVPGNRTPICKRAKLDSYLSPYMKINLKWIKDQNVKHDTTRRTTGKTLQGIYANNDFWIRPQSFSKKSKNVQIRLCQMKKLLHSKGNNQQSLKKIAYKMGKIFAN